MLNPQFSNGALKQFKKLDILIRKRIKIKIQHWFQEEDPLIFAIHLVGYFPAHYRFRVGEYRIVGTIEDDNFVIISIGHRREIYK